MRSQVAPNFKYPGALPGPRWGSLQRSPDPLAGVEGARCSLPENPTQLSALRASGYGPSLRPPPSQGKISPAQIKFDRRHGNNTRRRRDCNCRAVWNCVWNSQLVTVTTSLNKFANSEVELRRVGAVNIPVSSRGPVYNFLCCDVIVEKITNIDQNSRSKTATFSFQIVDRTESVSSRRELVVNYVHADADATRRDSTVESRRRQRCALGLTQSVNNQQLCV